MSKIVFAVNKMIMQKDKITDVCAGTSENLPTTEYFFKYNGKYTFSLYEDPKNEGEFHLCLYPGDHNLKQLANLQDFQGVDFVNYSTKDLNTREARESFRELFLILKEKCLGVDKIIDEIVEDEAF